MFRLSSFATVAAAFLFAAAAMGAGRHVAFVRVAAAPHDLGPVSRVALIYALGDNDMVRSFIDELVQQVERGEELPLVDVTPRGHHFVGDTMDEAELRDLHATHPADAYLGVNLFRCHDEMRQAPTTERDSSGARIPVVRHWVEARCEARLDAFDGHSGRKLFSFDVSGEGSSSRIDELTAEDRSRALAWAVRHMAINAAQGIAPRRVRESIELDPAAPMFDEAMARIEASDLERARQIWTDALRQHPDSAPLLFNLAAVSEALGDLTAARQHYEDAVRLAPQRELYRTELKAFRGRAAERSARPRRP
jgi:hypothetical protein